MTTRPKTKCLRRIEVDGGRQSGIEQHAVHHHEHGRLTLTVAEHLRLIHLLYRLADSGSLGANVVPGLLYVRLVLVQNGLEFIAALLGRFPAWQRKLVAPSSVVGIDIAE